MGGWILMTTEKIREFHKQTIKKEGDPDSSMLHTILDWIHVKKMSNKSREDDSTQERS
jgi:hypothetical protein